MTILFTDLFSLNELHEARESGLVRIQNHPDDPDLLILNYTEVAQWTRTWNMVTLNCRGLIVSRKSYEVIARPWRKFKNYGEHEVGTLDLEAPVEVTDKRDGSLGILYTDPSGRPAIATRGSFTSDQAVHATELYRSRYEGKWTPTTGATYLFEIIYPNNRIVLDYQSLDDLVLLGAVDIDTGTYFGPDDELDWPGPITQVAYYWTLAEALAAPIRTNAEGMVVRYLNDSGVMLKIKQVDYVELHRIITGLNERAVWEYVFRGETIDELLAKLPEEFQPWVRTVHNDLTHKASALILDICLEFWKIQDSLGEDAPRKEYAMRILESEHKPYLFMLLDKRSIWKAVVKSLRPVGASRKLIAQTEDAL